MIQTNWWASLAIVWSQYILFIKEKGWKTSWIGNLPAHVGILFYMNLSIKSNQRKTPVLFYLCVCVSLLGRVEALLSLPSRESLPPTRYGTYSLMTLHDPI